MSKLTEKKCKPCEGGVEPMSPEQIKKMLSQIPEWQCVYMETDTLCRVFSFKNYYQTMAFVNAIAWIAHQENHHPDLEVGYNHCKVCYSTHAIRGLSENDFICAAKVNALFDKPSS